MGYIPVPLTFALVVAVIALAIAARAGLAAIGAATTAYIIGSQWFNDDRFSWPGRVSAWWLLLTIPLLVIGILRAATRGRGRGNLGWIGAILAVVGLLSVGTVAASASDKCPPKTRNRGGVCIGSHVKKDSNTLEAGIQRTATPAGKSAAPSDAEIRTLIQSADSRATQGNLQSGPETAGGVDCVDGCVLFRGLVGANATEKLQDLEAKLTRSPTAADYLAHYVKQQYAQPYNVTATGVDKHVQDLMIIFGYINGADVSLQVMPKGTQVMNSVQKNGQIIQFPYVLPKDREFLSIKKDGHEVKVFTTCGNGISSAPIPGIPTVAKTPPQREFIPVPHQPNRPPTERHIPPPPGPPPTVPTTPTTAPKCPDANSICGTPTSGPEQQPVNSNPCCDTGTTPGYTPGSAEDNHKKQQDAHNNQDPYQPTPNGQSASGGGGTSPSGQSSGPDGNQTGGSAGTSSPDNTNGSGQTSSGDTGPPP